MGCGGNCASCSGCARELVLTKEELRFLDRLSQIPFLPVARMPGEEAPAFPEEDTKEMSLLLQCLEKKGLISLDYDLPIRGCDYGAYPLRGSLALTERGQQVVEMLQVQGFREE